MTSQTTFVVDHSFGRLADRCGLLWTAQHPASFDDLVGAAECQWRDREAERRGGLEIDHQLELGGPQEGQVGGLFTLENPGRVDPELALNFVNDWPVGHQSACFGKLTPWIYDG